MTGRVYYQENLDKLKGENEKWLKREQSQQKVLGDLDTIFLSFFLFFPFVWFLTVYETDSFIKCVFLPMWLSASFGQKKKKDHGVSFLPQHLSLHRGIYLGQFRVEITLLTRDRIRALLLLLLLLFFTRNQCYNWSFLLWRLLVMWQKHNLSTLQAQYLPSCLAPRVSDHFISLFFLLPLHHFKTFAC